MSGKEKKFLSNVVQLNPPYDRAVAYGCSFSVEGFNDDLYEVFSIPMGIHLMGAVIKRRAEYLAGRYVARKCLDYMGKVGFELIADDKRCPVWPRGITGSISHTNNYAVAISMQKICSETLGIDVENLIPIDTVNLLKDRVLTKYEKYFLSKSIPHLAVSSDRSYKMRLLFSVIFSAKESFFKAAYPKVKAYFDFNAASLVDYDSKACQLIFCVTRDLSSDIVKGMHFNVTYRVLPDDTVLTFVCLN